MRASASHTFAVGVCWEGGRERKLITALPKLGTIYVSLELLRTSNDEYFVQDKIHSNANQCVNFIKSCIIVI